MLDGTVIRERSNIDDTVSTYNIFKGRILRKQT